MSDFNVSRGTLGRYKIGGDDFIWTQLENENDAERVCELVNGLNAEITRLRAELERVRGQRDKALIELATKNHDILFADLPMAQCVTLADHGFRVLSYHGTRTVEEIES